jgi:hypothetical protein
MDQSHARPRRYRRRAARTIAGVGSSSPATRAWVFGWLGGPALGTANGIVRERFFTDSMGEDAAQRFSTATLLSALALYMWALESRWPLPSSRTAFRVGGTWALLTMAFEFGLGRARHRPWSELLGQYDITRGRVWVLVPLWMALGPPVMRALAEGSRAQGARTAL